MLIGKGGSGLRGMQEKSGVKVRYYRGCSLLLMLLVLAVVGVVQVVVVVLTAD